jgi:hypothetical protein
MNTFLKYSLIHFLIITFFITQLSFGQKPTIGVKAGLVFSNATINHTSPDTYLKTSGKNSVLGGVYLNVPSGKKLIFRPGAEIVSKGVKRKYYDTYNNTYSYDYPLKFTFIDFPINILYKINFPKGHLIAGGGPVIGVPINEEFSQYPLKTEFSINGIVGYEVAIGFSLNLNYTYGLSNANKDNQFISKISNRYLGITVGYTF